MAANGRRYGFSGTITGAASKTIVGVAGTSAVRPYLTDLMISSNATPADNSSEWQLLRFTAAGTSTAVTPEKYDTGDPAATGVCGKNHTVEPTYGTVPMLDIAHNQRATFRWVAAPGEEIGLLGNTASFGEMSISHLAGGTPGLTGAHIIFEPF